MPYTGLAEHQWHARTVELLKAHPLKKDEIVDVVLGSWDAIFESQIGKKGFRVGVHLFPSPQIMAFFLHELIALEFATRYPTLWRGEQTAADKDLVYIPDEKFSVEIKTSSHPSQIFGNRSYAQPAESSKKSKAGYYLAINFEKFDGSSTRPRVMKVRFGWLDHRDWIGQAAATGQQARLSPAVERYKLLSLLGAE